MKPLFLIMAGIAVLGGGIVAQIDVNRSIQAITTFGTDGINGVNKLNQQGPNYRYTPETGFTEGSDRPRNSVGDWFNPDRNNRQRVGERN